jgi:hypothetical protein
VKIPQKLANINKTINKTWNRFLVFVWIFIALVLVYVLFNPNPKNQQQTTEDKTTEKMKPSYTNCTLTQTNQEIDRSPLKTNTKMGNYNLLEDTDSAGVEKNEIPAITIPKFITYEEMKNCLEANSSVFVLNFGEKTKIYPKNILSIHQIVNDQVVENSSNPQQERSIVIVYSPFSDSVSAYISNQDHFFVSGRILHGNTLMFDEKTESLWLEINGLAIIGDRTGEILEELPIFETTFAKAISSFPNSEILSYDTGYIFDYSVDTYKDFHTSDKTAGNFEKAKYQIDPKEKILAVNYENIQKAYTKETIFTNDVIDRINDLEYKISFNESLETFDLDLLNHSNDKTPVLQQVYFYTWHSLYPQTSYY